MKSKGKMLLVSVVLLLAMSAVSASAAVAVSGIVEGESAYIWNGGNSLVLDMNQSSILGTSNSFSITGQGGSRILIDNGSPIGSSVTIEGNTVDGFTANFTAFGSMVSIDPLSLGTSGNFGFKFSNNTGSFSSYNVDVLIENYSYVLSNDSLPGVLVNIQTSATPSAVPIPGSALLLGSSLLGLLGIGSRKNKA